MRYAVFTEDQGIPQEVDKDGLDEYCSHIIAKYRMKPVGTVRIRLVGKTAKLERLAVLKNFRGKGIGKALVEYAIDCFCKKEITMHAQTYLKNFYEDMGFESRGKPFKEAGIDHIEMFMKPKKPIKRDKNSD